MSVGPVRAWLDCHFKHAARGGELRSTSAAILAAATGSIAALAVEPGAPAVLGLAAFSPLLFVVGRSAPRAALFAGWAAGAVFAFASHRFLPSAVAGPMNLGEVRAWGALALFAIYRGLPWGLASWSGATIARRGGRGPLAAAVVFTALGLVWPALLPFPFGASLSSQLELLQLADVLGPCGTTLLAVLCGAALAEIAAGRERATLAAAAVGLIGAFGYGSSRIARVDRDVAGAEALTARLVQPAHQRDGARALTGVGLEGAAADGADVTIWPESALPRPLAAEDAAGLASALFASPDGPVLAGALESRAGALSNVALLFEPGGAVAGRYEKRELVPLAEPRAGSAIGPWLGVPGHREGSEQPPIEVAHVRLSVTICYEVLVSSYVTELVTSTRGRAIVNLANDGWFRGATEPELHLLSSRLRAIETRRAVLRAANDGVTAAIDPAGRELARLPGRSPGTLTVTVPLLDEETIYARWGAAPLALVLVVLGAVATRAHRLGGSARGPELTSRRRRG